MSRFKVGDRVTLPQAPGEGVLTIPDNPHNRDPWSCTRDCGDEGCVEFLLDDGQHVNACEMEAAP